MKTTITNRRNGVRFSRHCNSTFVLLAVGAIFSCLPAGAQTNNQEWEGLPDPNAPWPSSGKQGNVPPRSDAKPVPVATPAVTPSTTVTSPRTAAITPFDPSALPASEKEIRHELALSADYLIGKGTVTLPFAFSLNQISGSDPTVVDADRDSAYYGASYAYSLGQSWYLDLGYIHGDSSGDFTFDVGVPIPAAFAIKDDWYQLYIRYTFPQLRGQRFQAYLRAGVSYVQSDLTVIGTGGGNLYEQQDKTQDIYGNLGLGVSYSVYRQGRFKVRVNADLDVFYGQRSSDVSESVVLGPPFDSVFSTSDSFNSAVFGGYAKTTIRFQYDLNSSGLLRAFMDGGVQARHTEIEYPAGLGRRDELLWGPYVKAGLLYSF